jgi:hypothetical protein
MGLTVAGLDSIVGRGNHSRDHVQKLKPRVEQVCRELGLQYSIEENTGRIYVNLKRGPANMPPLHSTGYAGYQGGGHGPQSPQQQQSGYPNQYQGGSYPGQQQQDQNTEIATAVENVLTRLSQGCEKCCVVM